MKNLSIFLFILFFCIEINAQGNLLIYPKRVVFDGSKRTTDLNLSNTGKDTARYIISVIQIRMTEEGKFETITEPDPGQNFADKNFRFFPRNVVLAPNEVQTVKIQLVNTGDLQPGEYRSHLYFRAEKQKAPAGEESADKSPSSISINLTPVFGISIPLIIKIGESTAKANFTEYNLEKKDSLTSLNIKIDRIGNMSLYGDIIVDHISPTGVKTVVASIQGVAVYAPTHARKFNIDLHNKGGIDYTHGKLVVSYMEQNPGKSILSQKEIPLSLLSFSSSK